MTMKILVTGGCGFIGSHLTDSLIERGYAVTVFDRDPPPKWKNPKAKYIQGNICDNLDGLLAKKFDAIFHLAAEVGSGLSMIDPKLFFYSNSLGTANLLEGVRKSGKFPRLLVASSATVYGEATYRCAEHGTFYPILRPLSQLEKSEWEVKCPVCRSDSKAVAIQEERILRPTSIYGQTKLDQEISSLLLAHTWGFAATAFRFFGVFGPRQSLCNPYTGVLALFATRVFAGLPIVHYEDGQQNKGYIFIDDVISALLIALENDAAIGKVFNIGLEEPVTIRYIAQRIIEGIDPSSEIIASGKYRPSDTRHSWPDISFAKNVLNWKPKTSFDDGLNATVSWLRTISLEEIKSSVSFFEQAEKRARSCGLEV